MQAGSAIRIEKNVDRAAALLLGMACAFPAYELIAPSFSKLVAGAAALVAALLAFGLCLRVLRQVSGDIPHLPVPPFEVLDFERIEARHLIIRDQDAAQQTRAKPFQALLTDQRISEVAQDLSSLADATADELLLTERFEESAASSDEPLLLDDVLAKLEPDSRVVRLFDTAPTPGQLKSRIDRHLDRSAAQAQSEDAARALHEALAELRRSMR